MTLLKHLEISSLGVLKACLSLYCYKLVGIIFDQRLKLTWAQSRPTYEKTYKSILRLLRNQYQDCQSKIKARNVPPPNLKGRMYSQQIHLSNPRRVCRPCSTTLSQRVQKKYSFKDNQVLKIFNMLVNNNKIEPKGQWKQGAQKTPNTTTIIGS